MRKFSRLPPTMLVSVATSMNPVVRIAPELVVVVVVVLPIVIGLLPIREGCGTPS